MKKLSKGAILFYIVLALTTIIAKANASDKYIITKFEPKAISMKYLDDLEDRMINAAYDLNDLRDERNQLVKELERKGFKIDHTDLDILP